MSEPTRLLLSPDLLLRAYAIGIFPMAESREATEIHWVEPTQRGIIPLESFHVPKSLRKVVRQQRFEVTVDQDFVGVIDGCAEPKEGRDDTWINPTIRRLYVELHRMGHAHSVECWREGKLVGGLYGVALGGAFFGESMFSREPDASKVALVHLVAILRKGCFRLLDTQFVTDHLERFGAVEVSRDAYRERLNRAINVTAQFDPEVSPEVLEGVLQSSSHTS
ncbi:leucyl/phenylalanyl-tRNA--protein transferase [Limibacillus halophilus]